MKLTIDRVGVDVDEANSFLVNELEEYPETVVDRERPITFEFATQLMGFKTWVERVV